MSLVQIRVCHDFENHILSIFDFVLNSIVILSSSYYASQYKLDYSFKNVLKVSERTRRPF